MIRNILLSSESDLKVIILDLNSEFVNLIHEYVGVNDIDKSKIVVLCNENKKLEKRYPIFIDLLQLSPWDQASIIDVDPIKDANLFHEYLFEFYQPKIHVFKFPLEFVNQAALHSQMGLRFENIGLGGWGIWKNSDEDICIDKYLESKECKCLIVDFGSIEEQIQKDVVANYIMNFLWTSREKKQKTLLIIDEAQNICPYETSSAITKNTKDIMVSISGEGRKYGLSLFLCSQQPSKIHENILSLCNNLILLQTTSSIDLKYIYEKFSQVPESFIQKSRFFDKGEALIAGKIVPTPIFMKFNY
jgi:hypothetical protein